MRHLTASPDLATSRARRLRVDGPHGLEALAAPFLRELSPRGPMQELLAGRIALAAAQLVASPSPQDEHRAERSLLRLLSAFDKLRTAAAWGCRQNPRDSAVREEDYPLEDLPEFAPLGDALDLDSALDASRLWRDRLTLDPAISANSPIVRGTWVTVNHIVTLVVDGWTWSDILRDHPELAEADIRACLTYAVEEEGLGPVS